VPEKNKNKKWVTKYYFGKESEQKKVKKKTVESSTAAINHRYK
jgi:hypothetical protein